jgi:rhodanese-related sulfurtransferase
MIVLSHTTFINKGFITLKFIKMGITNMTTVKQSNKDKLLEISSVDAKKLIETDEVSYLIDIRSSMELLFIGHPVGAIHIPWMDEPDWEINPHFAADIRKLLLGGTACTDKDHCANIILICRSGNRSEMAGQVLLEAGLNRVHHVVDGFEGDKDESNQRSTINGWRYHGLPWEQC